MGVCLNHIFPDQLPLRAISEQVAVIPAGGEITVSASGMPKFLYYYGGEVEMSLDDGSSYRIAPGDTLILPGPFVQRYRAPGSATTVRFHALVINFEQRESALHGAPGQQWDSELEDYLRETFPEKRHLASRGSYLLWELAMRLRHECEARRPMHGSLVCELARRMVLRVAEQAGLHRRLKLPKKLALVEKACNAALADPFTKPKKRDVAAETLGVSPATLNRTFKESLGIPYSRCMAQIGVERAKSFLLDSPLPISRIAKLLHFGSASAFDRAFKIATGLTPRAYQQSYDGTPVTWGAPPGAWNPGPPSGKRETPPPPERGFVQEAPGAFQTASLSLLLCLKGACLVKIGGSEMALAESDPSLVLVAGGKNVSCKAGKAGVSAAVLVLDGEALCRGFDGQEGALVLRKAHAALGRRGYLRQRFANGTDLHLLRAWMADGRSGRHAALFIRSLHRTLWIEALRMAGASGEGNPPPRRQATPAHRLLRNHAMEFIRKHYLQNLTLGDIAWAVGVSEEHLARTFRAESGKTVMSHLQDYRVHRAQILLVKSRKTITEIAELSGFSTVPLFCRVFKRHAGCTPGAFRERGELP